MLLQTTHFKTVMLFKETVDLPGPIFFGIFSFSYQTKHCYFNYSFQEIYQSNHELFTKTHFRTKCESAKSSFAAKHPGPWNSVA